LQRTKNDIDDNRSYLVTGITFSPIESKKLSEYIEEVKGISYESIKAFSISVYVSGDSFNYEISQL